MVDVKTSFLVVANSYKDLVSKARNLNSTTLTPRSPTCPSNEHRRLWLVNIKESVYKNDLFLLSAFSFDTPFRGF